MTTTMSLYETRLRGARNRLREAQKLTVEPKAQVELAAMVEKLTALIQGQAPIEADINLT